MRNVDALDGGLLELSSSASCQVRHVVDGHGVVAGQIGPTVMCEEPIYLPFALVFGTEGCSVHQHRLRLILILVLSSFMSGYLLLLLVLHSYNYEFDS